MVLPIEASLSIYDPLGKWEDHEACWQMQYRGSLGETLLHVLIICDTKVHTRLARTLLKCFPKLALDIVEGEEYLGASALHLAIAYSNNELVQDLVDAGANINQRAIGIVKINQTTCPRFCLVNKLYLPDEGCVIYLEIINFFFTQSEFDKKN